MMRALPLGSTSASPKRMRILCLIFSLSRSSTRSTSMFSREGLLRLPLRIRMLAAVRTYRIVVVEVLLSDGLTTSFAPECETAQSRFTHSSSPLTVMVVFANHVLVSGQYVAVRSSSSPSSVNQLVCLLMLSTRRISNISPCTYLFDDTIGKMVHWSSSGWF